MHIFSPEKEDSRACVLDTTNKLLIKEIDSKMLCTFIFPHLRKLAYYLEIIKTGKHNIYHVIWLLKKSLITR